MPGGGTDLHGRVSEELKAQTFRADASRMVPLWFGVFLSTTVLQRFAVPGGGSVLGLGFVTSFGVFVLGLFASVFSVSPPRLILYAGMTCALLVTLFAKTVPFSLLSLAMLLTLYLPYVATVEMSGRDYRLILNTFQRVMVFCSACGLGQFFVQFALGPDAMFPLDRLLPPPLFIPNFNLRIPVTDAMLKSTGLWFLEPSHLSQFLAFALIIELAYFGRMLYVALFAATYLCSFSGTGFLLLAAAAIVLLVQRRQLLPLLLLVSGAAIILLLRDVPPFSLFVTRLQEFGNPLSSGSMRFFAPYWFVHDVMGGNTPALLFGFGPGRVEELVGALDYPSQDSSWLKLFAEYGLLGAVPFFGFYVYALFRRSPDHLLSWVCFLQFLFLGGYLNAFYVQFLHMALVAWPKIADAPDASPPARSFGSPGPRFGLARMILERSP
jgi:hypothetical protein